jgi:hypothetical protein
MTLPRHVPVAFSKTYGSTTVLGSTASADIGEQRGAHHTSVPIVRGETEPYPRKRKKPRDQNVGKAQRTDIYVHGKQSRERTIALLKNAFPGKPWDSIGRHVVISGIDAKARILRALAPLGGKIETR